jgi:hypothetical protein
LHYYNPDDFAGAVCDESSILKSFDGTRRLEITEFMKKLTAQQAAGVVVHEIWHVLRFHFVRARLVGVTRVRP